MMKAFILATLRAVTNWLTDYPFVDKNRVNKTENCLRVDAKNENLKKISYETFCVPIGII